MKAAKFVIIWSHAKNGRAIMELKINLFDQMVPSSPNWFDARLICSHHYLTFPFHHLDYIMKLDV